MRHHYTLLLFALLYCFCGYSQDTTSEDHYQKSIEFYGQGKTHLSMEHINRAITLSEANPDHRYIAFRGAIYLEHNNAVKALSDFDKSIEIEPTKAYYYFERARAKNKLGDFISSIQDYNTSLELGYDSVSILKERSMSKVEIKDYDGAIEDRTLLTQLEPKEPKHLVEIGMIWMYAKKFKNAIEYFDKSIIMDDKMAAAYFYRSIAHIETKEMGKAIQDYTKSAELEASYRDNNIIEGIDAFLDEKKDKACMLWKNSMKVSEPLAKSLRKQYCVND